ncbi:MAG: hypothetical protein V7682_11615 [Cycloclasticus sp.]
MFFTSIPEHKAMAVSAINQKIAKTSKNQLNKTIELGEADCRDLFFVGFGNSVTIHDG